MPNFQRKNGLFIPESERINQEISDREKNKITCTEPQKLTAANCPECTKRIIVHCPECNQKVTGCNCTLKVRVAAIKDEFINRMYE